MKYFWIILFLVALIALVLSVLYLTSRVIKLGVFKKASKNKKWLEILLSLGLIVFVSIVLALLLNVINMGVCMIYLTLIWLICDLVSFIIMKITKPKQKKTYIAGFCAVCITIVYLVGAWITAHNVVCTRYSLDTSKDIGAGIKIAYLADSHVGTTFDGVGFAKQLDKIKKENPDVLFIVGDFVDDGTSKEDMLEACKALSEFETKYGIYYVQGNHDGGYYNNSKGYSYEDMVSALEENGVIVLEDEIVTIDNRLTVIGRMDKENKDRMDMDKLTAFLNPNRYIVVLDHQPVDYYSQANSKADLVLSGHTHGGQIFPFNKVGKWTGMNDLVYGHEKRGDVDFVVTSGISDWALKFKSGCKSEYVIINVK